MCNHLATEHQPGCWDKEEHICLVEDVQERNHTLLLGWCNQADLGLQLPFPASQLGDPSLAQAWSMKGTYREKRGYGDRE